MRHAVVAPDKFKGSLTALQAATAIERGLIRGAPDAFLVTSIPMADGGEGTVDAFLETGAHRIEARVRGPLGEPVDAAFALEGTTAIVEMAAASGLELVAPPARDVMRATTFGTGQLIGAALDAGARKIVIGVGGSATNDGGAGALQALGVRLLDGSGGEFVPGGAALRELRSIDVGTIDSRVRDVTFEVAADVDNPLCGPNGASAVFGPQKGARPDDVRVLDAALGRFADVTALTLGVDRRNAPGGGAAGGLGFALLAYLGARLRPGVEIVGELRGLPKALEGAALCLTGEGSIDAQTLRGKTVDGVARFARVAGVRVVIAFAGRIDAEAERALAERGVASVPIADGPLELDAALSGAAALLERAAARTARLLEAENSLRRP